MQINSGTEKSDGCIGEEAAVLSSMAERGLGRANDKGVEA